MGKGNDNTMENAVAPASGKTVLMEKPGICPSCGRETGNVVRCKFCCTLTSPEERIRVSSINYSTAILFIAALFYFAIAVNYRPQFDQIASLDESRAFQQVRVKAKVKFASKFEDKYKRRQTVQLELVDQSAGAEAEGEKTGREDTIKLKAEGDIAAELLSKNLVPKKGDIVEVSAALYAGPGFRMLSLNSPEFLKVVGTSGEGAAVETTVGTLLSYPEKSKNKIVTLKECVVTRRAAKLIIEVADAPGQKPLMVFGADPNLYFDGQKLSVTGRFVYYDRNDCWEIKVSADDPNAIVPVKQ